MCVCVCAFPRVCKCSCVLRVLCLCVHAHVPMRVRVRVCVCVCVCVCVKVCVHSVSPNTGLEDTGQQVGSCYLVIECLRHIFVRLPYNYHKPRLLCVQPSFFLLPILLQRRLWRCSVFSPSARACAFSSSCTTWLWLKATRLWPYTGLPGVWDGTCVCICVCVCVCVRV